MPAPTNIFQAEIAALMEALSGFPAEYLHTEGQERRELSKYIREAPTPEERALRQAECFTKLYMPSQSALQKAVKP